MAENSGIRILCRLNEVGEYMYKSKGDMVLLVSPEDAPMIFKCRD